MLNVSLAAKKILCCHQFSGNLSLIQHDNRHIDALTAKAAAYNVSQTKLREWVTLLNECVCA